MRRRISLWLRRHTRQCRFAGVVLMLGMAYFLITQLTPFRIPCLFQKITGFACPGCGVSHFCIRLLHLDIPGAARENLAIAVLAPIWLGAAVIRMVWHPHWLAKNSRAEKLLLWSSLVFLLLFGVVRNLPHMEFLLPSYFRKDAPFPLRALLRR